MSSLTLIEKQKLERELGMTSGYVLNFSNRTFEEFFREVAGVNIYDSRYDFSSGSKANRMRAFWKIASDDEVNRLLRGLLEAWDLYASGPIPDSSEKLLANILERLSGKSSERSTNATSKNIVAHISEEISHTLFSHLIKVSELSPQTRGYAFEKFLKELFDAYGLSARASFRLIGEQIDGSFVMHNETYLLEAKWQNTPTGASDLHTFEGKLSQKASWSRGLFVSNSGFSTEGLDAFGRGKRIVCMDGFDLSEILRRRLSFLEVLETKVRRAAESGKPFIAVRELFP